MPIGISTNLKFLVTQTLVVEIGNFASNFSYNLFAHMVFAVSKTLYNIF